MWDGHHVRILSLGWILYVGLPSRNLPVGWRVEGGGHYVRILYVGWSCIDFLCVVMWGGHHVFHFILLLHVDWPLHKDSLCGVAIMYLFLFCLSMWSGHYRRILYVGWPSCKEGLVVVVVVVVKLV